jgi:dephospho-CoA kinase
VVLMIPLLFEAGLESLCTEIWVVECGSEEEQLRRLQARDGLSQEAALARLRAQWPMAEKLARADLVLSTAGSPSELAARVEAALATASPGASAPEISG